MKSRSRNLDVIHHGMVLLSDGKGRGRPARLELTKDMLKIQVISGAMFFEEDRECTDEPDTGMRTIKLHKKKDGGLGLSIKGGVDGNQQVPVIISKIFPNMPAEECGLLYVGDAIAEINGELVDGKTHDEVVQMLKDAGDEVELSVRHYTHIAPFMKPADSLRLKNGGTLNRFYEPNTWKSSLKAHSSGMIAGNKTGKHCTLDDGGNDTPDGWKNLTKIPLPMAYITRYLWGTDKMRNNAFEVRAVDGSSTGIIHCEDKNTLDQWMKHIQTHIYNLNQKSIKLSNKYLHKNEQIIYIGWVCERLAEENFEDPRQRWEARFIILKGSELCIFDSPPLNSEDLNRCVYLYKMYETALKLVGKEALSIDRRDHCFWIETSSNKRNHYMCTETYQQFSQFESAYHRCLYSAVNSLQTRTFACSFDNRPCGLVLDIKQGISLYDITTKRYAWQYRFTDLQSSSDDGKIRLRLVFKDEKWETEDKDMKVKDIECDEVLSIVFTMHAFYITKIISCDPEFLRTIPLT